MTNQVIVTLKEPIANGSESNLVSTIVFDQNLTDESTKREVMEFRNAGQRPVFIPVHNILGVTYKVDVKEKQSDFVEFPNYR